MDTQQYTNITKYIKNKIIYIFKIRGEKKIQVEKGELLIKRPYIELITETKYANYLFDALSSKFTISLRNYKDKLIKDNLDVLKSVPLQKNEIIPKSVRDPFKIKFFNPSGQYGIGISFIIKNSGTEDEYTKLYDDLSFYDTKDLRNLETETFKDKVSILIFVNNMKHDILDIFTKLEQVLT